MRTLLALVFLAVMGYILWRKYKTYKHAAEVERRARCRRMEVERDRQVCRKLERLLSKEDT